MRGALEIEDEAQREKVAEALGQLWHAMDLSHPSMATGGYPVHAQRYRLYRHVGEMLLGEEDCPEFEAWT